MSTPRRPGGPARGHQPRYDGQGGAAHRDELVAGGPRHRPPRSGPPPGGRRPDGQGPRRRRRDGRFRMRGATGIAAVVTVSGLAIGVGVAIDRLVLPEPRSEQSSAAGPGTSPSTVIPPGPDTEPTAEPTKTLKPGKGGDDGKNDPTPAPTPTAARETPRPAPARPARTTAPAQPTKTGKPAARTSAPPSSRGGAATGGSAGSPAAEAAVVRLTNAERAKQGCDPLRVDQRLVTAARKHSADMAANDYFDHTSRNGDSPWKRMEDAGYPSPGAENIAKGYPTPEAVMKGWMNSPGHRANILNCGLRAIGVGRASGPGGPLWTQNFGWN